MQGDSTYADLLEGTYIPAIAKEFMNSTRVQVEHEHILVTASSFTFGREALLPSIFMELIKQPMLKDDKRLKKFELYLQRHIELDGDIHSHLAKKLVASICRSEKEWNLAENSALTAIKSRLTYWDNVYSVITAKKQKACSANCDPSATCNGDIENLVDATIKKCAVDSA